MMTVATEAGTANMHNLAIRDFPAVYFVEGQVSTQPAVDIVLVNGNFAAGMNRQCRWHRQVKLEEDGEASKLARAANLCGSLGASDLGPHRERLRADGSVLGGGEVIAMEAEEVVDLIVGGEEPLRLAG